MSQPYLFRLFPDKRAIFLAAARRCTDQVRQRFDEVSDGLPPEQAHDAMAGTYAELVADREALLFQMQMYVAAAVAEQAGDSAFAQEIRAAWSELWELAERRLGGFEEAGRFIATGMLINSLLAMGYPQDHRFWATCDLTRKHHDDTG